MTYPPEADFLFSHFIFGYIGPGAGFAFLGSFLVLFLALLLGGLSFLTWPLRFVYRALIRRRKAGKPLVKRVVVVGLDGLDAGESQRLMDAGRLPNLKKLAERGSFAPLETTVPPLSPVAWSSFMTGVNPGKHNIFDFLNRDLRTYIPELSSSKVVAQADNGWLSRLRRPKASIRNNRKSKPFWHILGEHGVFSTALRVPITFPSEKFYGLSLAGMCAPDLRGTQGSYTLFSSEVTEFKQTNGGIHIPVTLNGRRIQTYLPGPPDARNGAARPIQIPLRIELDPDNESAVVTVSGQSVRLTRNQYSEWTRVKFPVGLLRKASGICRFHLSSVSPAFSLYVTPLNIDPEYPAMPVSHPPHYSIYLGKLHGPFATLGLAEDTQALDEGALDETAFIEQVYAIHEERERMFFDALKRTRKGLCVCVFDASDRIQHMFFPRQGGGGDADRPNGGKEIVEDMYVRMDGLVGRVVDALGEGDALFVLSDHGFCRFDRGVHLNAWLRERGDLKLKDEAAESDYLSNVDWERTRAYAFGMSGIYLNRAGREAKGIVTDDEVESLKRELSDGLRELVDDERDGARPILAVHDTRKAYRGPYSSNGPDLVVGYAEGYRVSWETVLGRTDGPVFADNTKHWGGDHCVDRSLVPGVLFSSHKIEDGSPSITDLAPTVLQLLGALVPPHMDGKALQMKGLGENSAAVGSRPDASASAETKEGSRE